MGSNARMDPILPQNFGTFPGLPLQLLARNPFFQNYRPEPPLKGETKVHTSKF